MEFHLLGYRITEVVYLICINKGVAVFTTDNVHDWLDLNVHFGQLALARSSLFYFGSCIA